MILKYFPNESKIDKIKIDPKNILRLSRFKNDDNEKSRKKNQTYIG